MARDLKSVAYFLQYLNIEMQIQGFSVWCKEFTRFRDKRDFDICAQLISLARTVKLDQESLDRLRFCEAELGLTQDKSEYAKRLLSYLAAHASSESIEAMALYRLADIERGSGRFESALQNYEFALQISTRINDRATIPYLLHMIGVIHWAQESSDEAIRFYEMSLQHYRDLYSNWSEQLFRSSNIVLNREDVQRHIANVLRDIGDAYRKAGGVDTANRYLLESLEILEGIGATFERALTYISLGKLSRAGKLFAESTDYYERALKIAQEVESPLFETESLSRLAEVSYLAGNYGRAIDWAEKAVAMANVYNFRNLRARALLFAGLSQLMLGSISQSVDSLLSALRCASQYSSNVLRGVVAEIERILPIVENSGGDLAEKLRNAVNQCEEFQSPSSE